MSTSERVVGALKKALPWALVLLLAVGVVHELRGRGGLDAGRPAPPLSVMGERGARWNLQSFRGHVVVVNFWATWCPPCRHEAPTLTEAWRDLHAHGDTMIGISVDNASLEHVTAFAREIGMEFPIGLGDTPELGAYAVNLLPTTYVIDREGVIVRTVVGEVSARELREAIADARDN